MKPNLFLLSFFCLGILGCSVKSSPKNAALTLNSTPVTSQESAEDIPNSEISLLVVDDSGEAVMRRMSPLDYRGHLNNLLPSVEAAVLPAAKQTGSRSNPWGLRTVVVGVGLKLGLGGSIIGWAASGGLRMAFSNSVKPSIP